VVVGYKREMVIEALEGLDVTFYYNPFYRATNSMASLWFARDFMDANDDLILGNADVFWDQDILDLLTSDEREAVMLSDISRVDVGDYFFRTENERIVAYGKELTREERDCEFALSEVWAKGGEGGIELAKKVLETIEKKESNFHVLYEESLSLKEKICTVAKEIYGAGGVSFAPTAEKQLATIEKLGFGHFPVCMAKTQYSLSDNPDLLGRPEGFELNVREVYVSAGAGFIVVYTGSIMTMPGLPKKPAAYTIDIDNDGNITGLS